MGLAKFFQKYNRLSFLQAIYIRLFVKGAKKCVKYLRDCGAKIGNNCVIENISILGSEPYLVEIGDNVRFSGTNTKIFTHDGGVFRLKYMGIAEKGYDFFGKVKIGSNCFIGHSAIILKNVEIGDNCIIGAGSVVSKSIPANSVVAGVPAKVICSVEEYYQKNKEYYDDTVGWNGYKKRQYIEANMQKYDELLEKKKAEQMKKMEEKKSNGT